MTSCSWRSGTWPRTSRRFGTRGEPIGSPIPGMTTLLVPFDPRAVTLEAMRDRLVPLVASLDEARWIRRRRPSATIGRHRRPLRRRGRPRPAGGGRAYRADRSPGRRGPCLDHLSGPAPGVPAWVRVPRRAPRRVGHAQARFAQAAGPGRKRRHRGPADRGVSVRWPRRMAAHRSHRPGHVGCRTRSAVAPANR